MNWQCPRCETFNHTAEKQCEVCELAKPSKRAATKTAVKDTGLTFFPPPDLRRSGALTKPAEKSGIKITDRRSGALTKSAADDGKSAALKSSATSEVLTPPDIQPDKTISPNTAFVLFLLLIAGNVYLIYDYSFRQEIGIGSWLLGMVFGNVILFIVLGIIAQFIAWVTNLSKPSE